MSGYSVFSVSVFRTGFALGPGYLHNPLTLVPEQEILSGESCIPQPTPKAKPSNEAHHSECEQKADNDDDHKRPPVRSLVRSVHCLAVANEGVRCSLFS